MFAADSELRGSQRRPIVSLHALPAFPAMVYARRRLVRAVRGKVVRAKLFRIRLSVPFLVVLCCPSLCRACMLEFLLLCAKALRVSCSVAPRHLVPGAHSHNRSRRCRRTVAATTPAAAGLCRRPRCDASAAASEQASPWALRHRRRRHRAECTSSEGAGAKRNRPAPQHLVCRGPTPLPPPWLCRGRCGVRRSSPFDRLWCAALEGSLAAAAEGGERWGEVGIGDGPPGQSGSPRRRQRPQEVATGVGARPPRAPALQRVAGSPGDRLMLHAPGPCLVTTPAPAIVSRDGRVGVGTSRRALGGACMRVASWDGRRAWHGWREHAALPKHRMHMGIMCLCGPRCADGKLSWWPFCVLLSVP